MSVTVLVGKCNTKWTQDNFASAIFDLEHYHDVTLVEDVAGRVDRHPWEVLDFLRVPGKRKDIQGIFFVKYSEHLLQI